MSVFKKIIVPSPWFVLVGFGGVIYIIQYSIVIGMILKLGLKGKLDVMIWLQFDWIGIWFSGC
jgi:hypothetical protein